MALEMLQEANGSGQGRNVATVRDAGVQREHKGRRPHHQGG